VASDFQWPILPAVLAVGLLLLASPPVHPLEENEEVTGTGREQPGEEEVSA
jgi:hypothetical protein